MGGVGGDGGNRNEAWTYLLRKLE